MILYVNGDSHSYGTDAGGIRHSYGRHLAKHLGMSLKCDASSGSSNYKIIRTTKEYLKNNKPDLIIIGWTTWERQEWLYQSADNKSIYYQVNASGRDIVPLDLQSKYTEWVIEASDPSFVEQQEYYFHNEIYKLHLELHDLGIPHLFFNTYLFFQYTSDKNLSKVDWGRNYINPYQKESTFYYWLENQGYQPNKSLHFGKDGQKAWADKLLQDLTNIR